MALEVPPAIQRWMEEFAEAVRSQEPERGAELLTPDAVGFGTVVTQYDSRDELERQQWADVWPRTRGFRFDEIVGCWREPTTTTVAARWSSTDAESGSIRHGRATLVLIQGDGSVRAVHTHFSLNPGTAS